MLCKAFRNESVHTGPLGEKEYPFWGGDVDGAATLSALFLYHPTRHQSILIYIHFYIILVVFPHRIRNGGLRVCVCIYIYMCVCFERFGM